MTVATTNDYTLTAYQIYEAAYNILGVAQEGEVMTARMAQDAARSANLMIKTWGAQENLWRMTEGTLPMVAGQASYSLTNPRPLRIHSVRRKNQGIETPMTALSTTGQLAAMLARSTDMPTVIRNTPSASPLNGAIIASTSL